MFKFIFKILVVMIFSISTQAQSATELNPSKSNEAPKTNNEDGGLLSEMSKFKFGVALGFENYKGGYVNEAETLGTNRVVHIVDSQKYKPSLWLETHYIWDVWASDKATRKFWKNLPEFTNSAPGFYVGVRALGPGSDTFDAFSVGLLWSFTRTPIGKTPPNGQIVESINIGLGPVWHRTKKLANGIIEGQPIPSQYQDIKFDKRDETSWMLMVSVGF